MQSAPRSMQAVGIDFLGKSKAFDSLLLTLLEPQSRFGGKLLEI